MKTKARQDSIRKRRNIEEKYSWDPMSNADKERSSHKNRAIVATIIVMFFFSIIKLQHVQEHQVQKIKV